METNKFIKIDDINQFFLDPKNPRLPERLQKTNEKEVYNWMLTDATLIDLMASIAENGFFAGEPILVVAENGKKIVVEGNRRLAAIRLLENPELCSVSPKSVKTISDEAKAKHNIPTHLWVYECVNRLEAQNYLAFRHVSGVKQWPLIAKARYLYTLFEQKERTDYAVYKELAKEIGSKGSYVKKLIAGYQAYQIIARKDFFGIHELNEETFDLSLIADVLTNQPSVAEYVGFDFENDKPFKNLHFPEFEQLTKWLYQITATGSTRIGDNRNLRYLNKIVQNQDALKAFAEDGKSIKEATELTDLADENIRFYLQQALGNLTDAQKLIHKANVPSKKEIDIIEEINNSVSVIETHLRRVLRTNKLNDILNN